MSSPRKRGAVGVFPDLPIESYHADEDSISHTGLLDMAQSPYHFHALHLDGLRPPRPAKAGQLEGSMAHCAILEPFAFDKRYVVGPEVNRNTKVWHEFVESHPTVTCIQPDQRDTALAQSIAVNCLPDIAALLKDGRPEVSAYWRDPMTGVLCRCRPDFVSPAGKGVILLDVKTYSDASPAEFARQVARKGYHQQAAYYSDGYALASGKAVLGFVFVAVETSWPFAASACMLDDPSLEAGRVHYRALLDRYAECRATNTWPGYGQTIELISLPAWAMAA